GAVATGFVKHGLEVRRGRREPEKLAAWKSAAQGKASVGQFAEAARFGDLVVLAVKGAAAESAVELCGPEQLAGKTVIDTMNPIDDQPPDHGVISFFTEPTASLWE